MRLESVRDAVTSHLDGIPFLRHGPDLFGPGRPLGTYVDDLFMYFMGLGEAHPLLPLAYLRSIQGPKVATEVLLTLHAQLSPHRADFGQQGQERIAQYCVRGDGQYLGLPVCDAAVFEAVRHALDLMLANHEKSSYRTGALIAQMVAWYVGDPLVRELPLVESNLVVAGVDLDTRRAYELFAITAVQQAYGRHRLPLHERMAGTG